MNYLNSHNNNKMQRCLLLLSGGIDSVIATYWAKKYKYKVEALLFDFGHSSRKGEIECARKITNALRIPLYIIQIPLSRKALENIMQPLFSRSSIKRNDDSDIILFGNLITAYTIAAMYALTLRIKIIIIGLNAEDIKMYSSLTPLFFQTFEKLVSLWTHKKVKILTPFSNKTKSEIIKMGIKLGVPFKYTWSCGVNGEEHCGKCIDCVARKKAFVDAGVKDPTLYKHK